jgi:hypothetical protein
LNTLETRRRLLRYLATSPLALPLAAALWAEDAIPSVKDALNLFDFEEAARRTLPPAHWGYLATGVNDDRTVRANREAFDRVQIRARHLVDVSRVDTATEVLGQSLTAPLFLCPVSSMRAFHPEGELAVARAAKTERTVLGLSTNTTTRIEEVIGARGEPVWFQLYPSTDAQVMRALVKHAEAAGCRVLLLTVDMPLGPNRETQFRLAKKDSRPCVACHDGTFCWLPEPQADVRRSRPREGRGQHRAGDGLGLREAPARPHVDEGRAEGSGHARGRGPGRGARCRRRVRLEPWRPFGGEQAEVPWTRCPRWRRRWRAGSPCWWTAASAAAPTSSRPWPWGRPPWGSADPTCGAWPRSERKASPP